MKAGSESCRIASRIKAVTLVLDSVKINRFNGMDLIYFGKGLTEYDSEGL